MNWRTVSSLLDDRDPWPIAVTVAFGHVWEFRFTNPRKKAERLFRFRNLHWEIEDC